MRKLQEKKNNNNKKNKRNYNKVAWKSAWVIWRGLFEYFFLVGQSVCNNFFPGLPSP
jgi:hypothetical protein